MMLGVPTDNDPRRSADPPLATSLPPQRIYSAGQRSAEVRRSPASHPAAPHPNAYTVLGVPRDNDPRRSADPPTGHPTAPHPNAYTVLDNDLRRSAHPPLATPLPPTPTAGQRSAEVRRSPASHPAAPHPNAYTVLGVPTDNNPRRSTDPPLATPLPPTPTHIQCWTTIRGGPLQHQRARWYSATRLHVGAPLAPCHTATCKGPAGVAVAPLVPSSTLQCIAPLDSGTRYIVVVPTLPPGVPMDVDQFRGHPAQDNNCRRCQQPGHCWRDCPLRFDMRHIMPEELDELIMQLMARKDAIPADLTPVSADPTALDTEEDF
ncbi:hypothetical protein D9615_009328 [Tricholomella constricta]|uniref:CCHC-type domain-containing protein n=1 Tax=Tricholomella constricta TaxID=117010 RepID=A0A8H5H2Z3_9AGAR|nr:hypothetical protein D9615_009328 [Tricholomella constricta]